MSIKKFLVFILMSVLVFLLSTDFEPANTISIDNLSKVLGAEGAGLLIEQSIDNYFPALMNHTWQYRWWNDTYEPYDIIDNVTLIDQDGIYNKFRIVSTHYWSHYGELNYRLQDDGIWPWEFFTIGGSNFPVPLYYAFHILHIGSRLDLPHYLFPGLL